MKTIVDELQTRINCLERMLKQHLKLTNAVKSNNELEDEIKLSSILTLNNLLNRRFNEYKFLHKNKLRKDLK